MVCLLESRGVVRSAVRFRRGVPECRPLACLLRSRGVVSSAVRFGDAFHALWKFFQGTFHARVVLGQKGLAFCIGLGGQIRFALGTTVQNVIQRLCRVFMETLKQC